MIQGSCLCGAVRWQFEGQPDGATACNCTACRRYGVLWAYDYEDEGIKVSGKTLAYVRGKALEFHFCPVCGCVAFWRGLQKDQQGRSPDRREPASGGARSCGADSDRPLRRPELI